MAVLRPPFALSLSKGALCTALAPFDKLRAIGNTGSARTGGVVVREPGFDKLSPNGVGGS